MDSSAGDDNRSVISISCGSSHSVALIDCDIVTSWGRGEDGQLGHGDSAELQTPRAVQALIGKGISAVYCGAEYTFAVSHQNDIVYSWGWGDFGRLGHGDGHDVFIPRPLAFFTGTKVQEIACGDTHTLVLTADGALYSFGRNQNGQLGLGHTSDELSPQRVMALQGHCVASIACGAEHSVVATSSGKVYCWGWGRYGNLGDGHREDRLLPTATLGLEGVHVSKVAAGWRHSLAVSDRGLLHSFGWSRYGQLGQGDNSDRLTGCVVEALKHVVITAVAGGWRHTAAVDASGVLYTWGWNKFGQLGLGDTEDRCSPTPVPALSSHPIRLLACGWRHTMAVTAGGDVYSWGRGVNGQLGHGSEEDLCSPKLLTALSRGTLRTGSLLSPRLSGPPGHPVAPADRYAVVPDNDLGPAVPDTGMAAGEDTGAAGVAGAVGQGSGYADAAGAEGAGGEVMEGDDSDVAVPNAPEVEAEVPLPSAKRARMAAAAEPSTAF